MDSLFSSEIQLQINHIKDVCDKCKPLVVVQSITYNHEKYLRDTLDGFVMQQTNFPFVAIVHDDASTDGTATILREYSKKYPNIILPIFETQNQYSKFDGSLGQVIRAATMVTNAKFVAMCEGDDYWTDPLKLQKQVDFLESNPDYSMCFHNAMVHYEIGNQPDYLFASLQTREYDVRENMGNWVVPTASMMIRKSVFNSPFYNEYRQSDKIFVGDYPLIQTCAKEGKIYCISEVMSVYRLVPTGWTLTTARDSKIFIKFINQELEYRRIFGDYHKVYTPKAIARHSRAAISLFSKGQFREAFKIWKIALRYAPWATIKANCRFAVKLISNKIKRNG